MYMYVCMYVYIVCMYLCTYVCMYGCIKWVYVCVCNVYTVKDPMHLRAERPHASKAFEISFEMRKVHVQDWDIHTCTYRCIGSPAIEIL